MATTTRISDLIVRMQEVFLERDAPLTAREVRRRLQTDDITCRAVLSALVDASVLVRLDDLYMRASSRFRPANPPRHRSRQAA